MKAASVSELKRELAALEHGDLLDACVRLAKFKADNKELLTYLLMRSDDEQGYADEVCQEISGQIGEAAVLTKKTMRKILRWAEKCIRYSGIRETELQIRIHFCREISDKKSTFGYCKVSRNMYSGQLAKIEKALERVHADLRFDFRQQMAGLEAILLRW